MSIPTACYTANRAGINRAPKDGNQDRTQSSDPTSWNTRDRTATGGADIPTEKRTATKTNRWRMEPSGSGTSVATCANQLPHCHGTDAANVWNNAGGIQYKHGCCILRAHTGTAITSLSIDLGLIGYVTVQERDLAGEIWWGTLYEASVVSPPATVTEGVRRARQGWDWRASQTLSSPITGDTRRRQAIPISLSASYDNLQMTVTVFSVHGGGEEAGIV
ncbi:hypothetical protein EDD15DRAFT_2192404 [Pisolithus albus]|nr:hypothetical protein EDD15DRAFT_2192404 [Pisolithus albus]